MNYKIGIVALCAVSIAAALFVISADSRKPQDPAVFNPAPSRLTDNSRAPHVGLDSAPGRSPATGVSVGSAVRILIDDAGAGSRVEAAWLLMSKGRSVRLFKSPDSGQFETVRKSSSGSGTLLALLGSGGLLVSDTTYLAEDSTWVLKAAARLTIAPLGDGIDAFRFHAAQVRMDGAEWTPAARVRDAATAILERLDAADFLGARAALQAAAGSGISAHLINATPVALAPGPDPGVGRIAPTVLVAYAACDVRYSAVSADLAVTYDPNPLSHGMTVDGNRVTTTGRAMSPDASAPVRMQPGQSRTVEPLLERFASLRVQLSQAGPPAPGTALIQVYQHRYLLGDQGRTQILLEASAEGEVGSTLRLTRLIPGPRLVSAISKTPTPGQAPLCLVSSAAIELTPGEELDLDLQLGAGVPVNIAPVLHGPQGEPVQLPQLADVGILDLYGVSRSVSPGMQAHFTHLTWELRAPPAIAVYGLQPGKYLLIWDLTRFGDECGQALRDLGLEIDPTDRAPSLEFIWTGDGPAEVEFPVNLRNVPQTTALTVTILSPPSAELRRVEATGVRDDGKWEYLRTEPAGGDANPLESIVFHCPPDLQRIILTGSGRDAKYCGLLLPDRPQPHSVQLFEFAEVLVSELSGASEVRTGIHVIRMKPAGADGELLMINNARVEGPDSTIKVPTGGCIVDIGYGPTLL